MIAPPSLFKGSKNVRLAYNLNMSTLRLPLFALLFALGLASAAPSNAPPVTFNKDVAPVLQKNCQGCHRPGEAAPMSFLTYGETRPWAKAIRQAVLQKKMPPWLADPHFGKFSNDRSLTQKETDVLLAWAETGAREGDPADLPKPAKFVDGWNIGEPDMVFEMPLDFNVPASGTIDYQYIVVPTNLKEDRWIQMAEVRAGNRAVVHHVIAFVRTPGSKWFAGTEPGVPVTRQARGGEGGSGEFLVGYAPGTVPEVLEPGRAKLIKAGSDIVFQLHYTANGKAGVDRSKVGVIFAKEEPRERVLTIAASNNKFVIPAGDANYQVDSSFTFKADGVVVGFLPHMHLRGKDFEYRVIYPTGEKETLLRVPRYDFNWQLSYYPVTPIVMPKGTRIECTAHFDNSANNKSNPDPSKEVRWGDQSWEEMMIGFVDVAIDVKADPMSLFREKKPAGSDD